MLGTLLETILLFINAIAILNEKRFLKKCRVLSMQMDFIRKLPRVATIQIKY
jgi:hypothetical protein